MTVIPTRQDQPQIVRVGAAPPQQTQSPGGFTGKDFLRILRKRIWLILLILAFFIGASVVATFLWLRMAPYYTAEAFVEVRPPKDTALSGYSRAVNQDMMERIMMTQASMVKSNNVLSEAVKSEKVTQTNWFKQTPKTQVTQVLEEEVSVGPVPNSNLLRISMTGFDKKELPEIVTAVAEAAVQWSRTQLAGTHTRELSEMRTERTSLVTRLDTLRGTIREQRARAQAGNLDERRDSLLLELRNVIPMRADLTMQRDAAQAALDRVREDLDRGTLEQSPEVMSRVEMDPRIQSLRQALMDMETRRDTLLRQFGRDHRQVQEMESSIEGIKQRIERVKAEIIEQEAGIIVSMRERELELITKQLLQVSKKFTEINSAMRDLQRNLDEIAALEQEAEGLEENIKRIDARMLELRLLEQGAAPMFLVQSAVEPDRPSMPKWTIMVPLGVVLGLMFGVGLAVLLEFIDTSIRTPSDVGRRVDLPLLGMVPHADDIEEDLSDVRMALLSSPNSLMTEAFRQIRTNLLFSGPEEQRRSLLITSASPSDGRTTVAMNLAASIAHGGRRVLLIDANFRKPTLRSMFPQLPEGGLSSALVGQKGWREMVAEIEPNLNVMAAGPLPPNPSELLGSDQMKSVLEEMTQEYDQVIFDGAPCLVVTDAVVLSSLVDSVILVVRAGANSYGIVQRARDTLRRVGCHILGAVLQGVRTTAGGYLRKNYDTYYDYQEHAQLPPK